MRIYLCTNPRRSTMSAGQNMQGRKKSIHQEGLRVAVVMMVFFPTSFIRAASSLQSPPFSTATPLPRSSRSMVSTLPPCIVKMQQFLREINPPPLSLAQGIVHWTPPASAVETVVDALGSGGDESKTCKNGATLHPFTAYNYLRDLIFAYLRLTCLRPYST